MSKAGHNLLQIAQVLKSNGTDGELVMGFREMGPEEIDLNEPVFIIFDGLPVPFLSNRLSGEAAGKPLFTLRTYAQKKTPKNLSAKQSFLMRTHFLSRTLRQTDSRLL